MTSQPTTGPEQQRLEGRTVRDIVEHDPAQVNEVWCRKIFRQLLQSLELQYAMQMPHRAITPDTVVFHDNGEPLLIPSDLVAAEQGEAADLAALARVVHFAITRELVPAGPLHGRGLADYSESLLTAVDGCMDPDPARRPQHIDDLRHILGIVSLGPVMAAPATLGEPEVPFVPPRARPAPVPTAAEPFATTAAMPAAIPAAAAPDAIPSFLHEPAKPRGVAGLTRWQRWAVAAGGGAFLLAIALSLFAELRDSGSFDHIVLTLPQSNDKSEAQGRVGAPLPARTAQAPLETAQPAADGTNPDAPAPAAVPPTAQDRGLQAAADDGSPPLPAALPASPQPRTAPAAASPHARQPAPAATGTSATGMSATGTSATYRLQIQPWGVVYVDGVDRGVSPPVKRLTLAPGQHTIRVSNPNFHDRVLELDTARGNRQVAVDFSDEPR